MAHSECKILFVGQMDLEISHQEGVVLEYKRREYVGILDVEEAGETKTYGNAVNQKGDK